MIISIVAEKAFDKSNTHSVIKIANKLAIERDLLNMIKDSAIDPKFMPPATFQIHV